MKTITVLMTGAGAPGAPGIIRCLRNNGERPIRLIGVDKNADVPTRSLFDACLQVPAANDPGFADAVLEICLREHVQIVLPIVTRELEVFAARLELFAQHGIGVSVMEPEALHIANNKGLLLTAMRDAHMPVPAFALAHTADEVAAQISAFGYPEKAVVVKPTFGNGSRGTRILYPEGERFDAFFQQKPDPYRIGAAELLSILREKPQIPEMMVMEYLPGTEYSVDVLADHGETLCRVCRRGLKVVSSNMTDCVIEENAQVTRTCEAVVRLLGLSGNVGFDLKERADGTPVVMEINPRLTAGVVACALAGVNFPYLRVKQLLGEEIHMPPVRTGIMMQRRNLEVFFAPDGSEINWQ